MFKLLSEYAVRSPETEGTGSSPSTEGSEAAPASETGDSSSPSEEAAGASAGADGDSTSSQDTSAPATSSGEVQEPDWREKRIAKLTAQLHEAKKKAQAPAPAKQEGEPAKLDPTEDFNQRVSAAAAQQVAAREFNKSCTDAANRGKEKYGKAEFQGNLTKFQQLIDQTDQDEVLKYNGFLQAALEAGHMEDIIYDLGADLNRAQKILEMSPIKMAVELTKMAQKYEVPVEPEEVSKVPKPIRTVGGQSGDRNPIDPTDSRSDNLSTQEWMQRREAQIAAQSRR